MLWKSSISKIIAIINQSEVLREFLGFFLFMINSSSYRSSTVYREQILAYSFIRIPAAEVALDLLGSVGFGSLRFVSYRFVCSLAAFASGAAVSRWPQSLPRTFRPHPLTIWQTNRLSDWLAIRCSNRATDQQPLAAVKAKKRTTKRTTTANVGSQPLWVLRQMSHESHTGLQPKTHGPDSQPELPEPARARATATARAIAKAKAKAIARARARPDQTKAIQSDRPYPTQLDSFRATFRFVSIRSWCVSKRVNWKTSAQSHDSLYV